MEDRVTKLEQKVRRLAGALVIAVGLAVAAMALVVTRRAPSPDNLSFHGADYSLELDASGIVMKKGGHQLGLSASTMDLRESDKDLMTAKSITIRPGMVMGNVHDSRFELGSIEGITRFDLTVKGASISLEASSGHGATGNWLADTASDVAGGVNISAQASEANVAAAAGKHFQELRAGSEK